MSLPALALRNPKRRKALYGVPIAPVAPDSVVPVHLGSPHPVLLSRTVSAGQTPNPSVFPISALPRSSPRRFTAVKSGIAPSRALAVRAVLAARTRRNYACPRANRSVASATAIAIIVRPYIPTPESWLRALLIPLWILLQTARRSTPPTIRRTVRSSRKMIRNTKNTLFSRRSFLAKR